MHKVTVNTHSSALYCEFLISLLLVRTVKLATSGLENLFNFGHSIKNLGLWLIRILTLIPNKYS